VKVQGVPTTGINPKQCCGVVCLVFLSPQQWLEKTPKKKLHILLLKMGFVFLSIHREAALQQHCQLQHLSGAIFPLSNEERNGGAIVGRELHWAF